MRLFKIIYNKYRLLMLEIGSILLILFFFSNCFVTHVRFKEPQPVQNIENQEKMAVPVQSVNFVSVGLGIYQATAPVRPVCNEGQSLDNVTFEMDIVDNIIHFFVGGIYTQRKVRVYCR